MLVGWTYRDLQENKQLRDDLLDICLKHAIAHGCNLDQLYDVQLLGSRAFPDFLHKYITPNSDADLVVLLAHIDYIPNIRYDIFMFCDVKCVLQFRITNRWFGYEMPYYSLLYDHYYCPDDLSGVWYQLWRKKVFIEPSDPEFDPKPYAKCTLCGKHISFIEDEPTFGRIMFSGKHKIHKHLFLCETCADKLISNIKKRETTGVVIS